MSGGDPCGRPRPVPLARNTLPPRATLPSPFPECGCVPTPLHTAPTGLTMPLPYTYSL
ncbi:MAG TPA: hypothetical protein VK140_05720 [Ktedonobacteraceae bacterium]|nr:hypothetical protein [Ktedonobacteraceae bacterium]